MKTSGMRSKSLGFGLMLVSILFPAGAFGHSYGPAPHLAAAPGESPRACTQCHAGNALNSGAGSVRILLASGAVYIPGVKQRLMVHVADPVQKRWGFELSARLDSDPQKTSAGDFAAVDNQTQTICEDNAPKPCATGPTFVTHTSAGTRSGTTGGATFQVDWTPPATNAGTVTLYVAGNAANADGKLTGDFIYTSSVQLTPAIPSAPAISASSVVNAATGLAGPVAPNSWATVYGSNLGVTARSWSGGDFVNGGIPFSLDGVSVLLTQFGAPRLAYVGYVSPNQINFLLPSDLFAAATTMQVRNPAGITAPVPLTVQANAAQVFTLDGKNVLATHADGSFVGRAGLVASVTSSPAAPGETITVFATGLGGTSPALIPGQLPSAPAGLATLPQATIGGAPATVVSGGIAPGVAGEYQLSIQVPANAASGDLPLVIQVGTASTVPVVVTVQK